jgi:hypothetical protein
MTTITPVIVMVLLKVSRKSIDGAYHEIILKLRKSPLIFIFLSMIMFFLISRSQPFL